MGVHSPVDRLARQREERGSSHGAPVVGVPSEGWRRPDQPEAPSRG